MRRISNPTVLSYFILGSALFVSVGIVAHAQIEPTAAEIAAGGIAFPVPELGNCANRAECAKFCSDTANMPACIQFAKKHGLMNAAEAVRAEKFHSQLQGNVGPGGCRSPRDCHTYCSNLSNIEECVRFAESQGFTDRHVEEGKKVLTYLKAGGQTPGGCNSKEACERYCGDFSHAQECFDFAQRAGIVQVRENVPGEAVGRFEGGIPPGQFQKFLELVNRGETPGGCKSKETCETYCSEGNRFEECVSFGEKVGFIEREQGEKIRKLGGHGPGGCDSPQACQAYCASPEHHEECFRFAEEHGFISKEEAGRAREGFVQLKIGLEQTPPEVAACVKSVLGQDLLEKIQSGQIVPGPEIAERMRGCFERFHHEQRPHQSFADAPPPVVECLKAKLGDTFEKIKSGEVMPTPEIADTFRVCFQQVQFIEGRAFPPPGVNGRPHELQQGGPMMQPQGFYDFLRGAPPEVASCLQEKLGGDYERLKTGGNIPTTDLKEKMRACFESFRPHQGYEQRRFEYKPPEYELREGQFPGGAPSTAPGLEHLPVHVIECVKSIVGANVVEQVQRGEKPIAGIGEQVKLCIQKFQGSPVNLLPPPGTQPGPGQICVQVVTPAYDPATKVCKQFPTPCDVPAGWIRGCLQGTEPSS